MKMEKKIETEKKGLAIGRTHKVRAGGTICSGSFHKGRKPRKRNREDKVGQPSVSKSLSAKKKQSPFSPNRVRGKVTPKRRRKAVMEKEKEHV